jgi:hypothetical protein
VAIKACNKAQAATPAPDRRPLAGSPMRALRVLGELTLCMLPVVVFSVATVTVCLLVREGLGDVACVAACLLCALLGAWVFVLAQQRWG